MLYFTSKNLFIKLIVAFSLLGWISYEVYAYSSGITGRSSSSSQGCNCHGSSSSSTSLSVSSSSGSFTVLPGESETFTVSVANSGQTAAGANIAVRTSETGSTNAGTVSAGSGLKKSSNELVHDGKKSMSDGKADFAFTWTAPAEPGKYYIQAAGNAVNDNNNNNGDEWNFMDAKEIIVPGIEINLPSGGDDFCSGDVVSIIWEVTEVANINIELSDDGGDTYSTTIAQNQSGSGGSYSWSVPGSITPGDMFKIRISDASNSDVKAETGNFSIGSQPVITSHPVSDTICEGESITLTVEVTGANLVYEWKRNGSVLAGETASSLTISNATQADAGNYTVTISSDCGDPVTSNPGSISVNESAKVLSHPQGATECQGGNINLTVEASGLNYTIAWQKDGEMIAGENSATLSLTNLQPDDSGEYVAVVSSDCGNDVKSDPATVTVTGAPEITSISEDTEICLGETLTLSVMAEGGDNLVYKWFIQNQEIPNSNKAELVFDNATKDLAGNYKVEITNDCGLSTTSDEIAVTITPLPLITLHPQDKEVFTGANVSFTVQVDAAEPTYQWYKDDAAIDGANSATLNLMDVSNDDAGIYYCEVSNNCGSVKSEDAELKVSEQSAGPLLSLSQTSVDFGNSTLNASVTRKVTITNNGDENLSVTAITVTGANSSEFMVDKSGPLEIMPGGTEDLLVTFEPESAGAKSAIVEFESNSIQDTEIILSGSGVESSISVSITEIDFDDVEITSGSDATFTVTNLLDVPVSITSMAITDDEQGAFSIISPSDFPAQIDAAGSLEVKIGFNPPSEGEFSAALIMALFEEGTYKISLMGTGVPSSVEDYFAERQIRVYPNPANEIISFEMPAAYTVESIKVYGINGSVLLEKSGISGFSGEFSIDSGIFAPGTYTAVINTNSGIKTVRFVVE